MDIESNRIDINGFLHPLELEFDKRYRSYPYRMIPNYIYIKKKDNTLANKLSNLIRCLQ